MKYSRFLQKMINRGGEPLIGIKRRLYLKCLTYNKLLEFDTEFNIWMTFGCIFSETNLDSSFIDITGGLLRHMHGYLNIASR